MEDDEMFAKITNKIKAIVKKQLFILIAIVIIVTILIVGLSSLVYFLDVDAGIENKNDPSNVPGQISIFFDDITIGTNGLLNTDWLETGEELWDRLVEANSNIETYLKNEDDLMKLVNAQIVTQYLDTREDPDQPIDWDKMMKTNGWIEHGIIKLKRADSNGNTTTMTFMEAEQYYSLIDSYNAATNDSTRDALWETISKRFTIEGDAVTDERPEEGEEEESAKSSYAVIAKRIVQQIQTNTSEVISVNETKNPSAVLTENVENYEETYSITTEKINYQSLVAAYTMPFNYLWAMTVISDDKDFVLELADLVYGSEMEVTVFENLTTKVTVDNITYKEVTDVVADVSVSVVKREFIEDEYIDVTSGPINGTFNDQIIKEHTTTITTNTISDTTNIRVTKVNCWFVEYTETFVKEDTTEVKDTQITQSPDEIPSQYTKLDFNEDKYGYINYLKGGGDIVNYTVHKNDVEERVSKVEIMHTLDQTVTNSIYISQGVEARGKDEKNPVAPNEDEENFVTLLCKASNSKANSNIRSASSWLFEILEANANTSGMLDLTKYLLYKVYGINYGVTEMNFEIYQPRYSVTTVGNLSIWGTTLSREEFIEIATNHSSASNYQTYIVPYLGDFYDICVANNVNPVIALAHACLETEWGGSSGAQNDKNYFGMAHGNTQSSGYVYSSPAESIQGYCEWLINRATPGTSGYNSALAQSAEYGAVNDNFYGTPDTNLYVLYSEYAFLGAYHYADESDFSNPKGQTWYLNNGSTWGLGGRVYIYDMYELGGLYTGEYAIRCNHSHANDPTEPDEQADYAVYSMNKRLQIATDIFGANILASNFTGSGQSQIGYGGVVYPHYLQTEYSRRYGTSTISDSGCGPTSMAMIIAGLTGDASVTPTTVVDKIEEIWPSWSSYYTHDVRN